MISKGYKSAFVVAYEGGERKTLNELGIDPNNLPDNYNESNELNSFVEARDTSTNNGTNTSNIVNGIDMSKVKYRVKLAAYPGAVPNEVLDILYNIGNVKPVKDDSGTTTYYSKKFNSKEEAENAILDYKTYGLEQLTSAVEYEGKYYTIEEFEQLLKP